MKPLHKYVWVGVRFSDIEKNDLFEKAIVIFGNGDNVISYEEDSKRRINHNISNEEIDRFFCEQLSTLISEDDNVRFMFYNQRKAYEMSDEIVAHSICINDKDLLEKLDDKILSRRWLGDSGNLLPYFVEDSDTLVFKQLKNRFPHYSKYIVQKAISIGGEGTFLISSECDFEKLTLDGKILVSPYIDKSISINGHAIIYGKNALIFPLSIQIITENENGQLIYRGGDFIAYQHLERDIRIKAELQMADITEKLRKDGYRGIVGVDFIVDEGNVYFMEINPRYQASSFLIDRVLKTKNMPSLQELNLRSFTNYIPKIRLDEFDVPYSSFAYFIGELKTPHNFLRLQQEQTSEIEICIDGYSNNCNEDKGAYAYRLVFPFNIVSAESWYGVRIHPNIYDDNESDSLNTMKSKIELINGGLYIHDATTISLGNLREAVFLSRDIEIFNGLRVNCPITPFAIISPYAMEIKKQKLILTRYDKHFSDVQVDIENPSLAKEIRNGLHVGDIAFLSTDRIRINHSNICKYYASGVACAFCSGSCKTPYGLDDIIKAIDICLNEINFRHFLIGGGSTANEQSLINKIVLYIRSKSNKEIYVMCLPPDDNESIKTLHENGVNEIAFNLELYSQEYAEIIMPGKSTIRREHYFDILQYAVSLWGRNGTVRSMLIVGLEPIENTLKAVQHLCKIGVQPMLSLFRPMKGTALEYVIPLSNQEAFKLYQSASKICSSYNQVLGPTCLQCRNNTLS